MSIKSSSGDAVKQTSSGKSSAKKTTLKTAPAKKSSVKKASAKKSSIKKSPNKKYVAKKAPAKKASATRESVKKKAVSQESSPHGNILKLNSVLAINDAKKMYAKLVELSKGGRDIEIDASAVEMIDTAVLQILLAFIKKLESQKRNVRWISPSKDIVSKSTTLDIAQYMELGEAGG